MGRFLAIVAVALVAAVGWRAYVILDRAGEFRTLTYTDNSLCQPVGGAVGAEDLQVEPGSSGFVFVSAFDRRRFYAGQKATRGSIGIFEIGTAGVSNAVSLTGAEASGAPAFAPHGMSLFARTLAVINHANGDSVEIFDVTEVGRDADLPPPPLDRVRLVHRRTIKSPLFRHLNDLALVGPDQFYASNDHRYREGFMRQLEDYLGLDATDLVYFGGKEARVAAKGLTYANGVAVSPDGAHVYVAETTDNTIRTYARDAASGNLELLHIENVHSGVDNIDVAPDGSLFIGAHPKLFALLKHFKDPSHPSPSEVIHLIPKDDGWERKTVFMDDGRLFSAGSVAATGGSGHLVLGSIFAKDILVCPYKE